jgi:N-acetylglutamate synthase-like GNAT family acetyltransferase
MTFTMREAHEDDAAFIRQLFAMPHVREFLNAPSREMIVAGMENPNSEVYIIETDGEAAGNLVLHHHGFLVDVALVIAAYQRRGIGTFALRWALHRSFAELHAHRVFLEVRAPGGSSSGSDSFRKASTATAIRTSAPVSSRTCARTAFSNTNTMILEACSERNAIEWTALRAGLWPDASLEEHRDDVNRMLTAA